MGLPYDQKVDIWSVGCIVAELWTGFVLFQNETVQSLLARIVGIIGPLPDWMMSQGKYVHQYFTRDKEQLYVDLDATAEHIPECDHRVRLIIPKKSSLEQRLRTEDTLFLDFIKTLLTCDPRHRPCASGCRKRYSTNTMFGTSKPSTKITLKTRLRNQKINAWKPY